MGGCLAGMPGSVENEGVRGLPSGDPGGEPRGEAGRDGGGRSRDNSSNRRHSCVTPVVVQVLSSRSVRLPSRSVQLLNGRLRSIRWSDVHKPIQS